MMTFTEEYLNKRQNSWAFFHWALGIGSVGLAVVLLICFVKHFENWQGQRREEVARAEAQEELDAFAAESAKTTREVEAFLDSVRKLDELGPVLGFPFSFVHKESEEQGCWYDIRLPAVCSMRTFDTSAGEIRVYYMLWCFGDKSLLLEKLRRVPMEQETRFYVMDSPTGDYYVVSRASGRLQIWDDDGLVELLITEEEAKDRISK